MTERPWEAEADIPLLQLKASDRCDGMNSQEPTVGDKIREKVVSWFLMWLSKIAQEAAESAQAKAQKPQGRSDPFS